MKPHCFLRWRYRGCCDAVTWADAARGKPCLVLCIWVESLGFEMGSPGVVYLGGFWENMRDVLCAMTGLLAGVEGNAETLGSAWLAAAV